MTNPLMIIMVLVLIPSIAISQNRPSKTICTLLDSAKARIDLDSGSSWSIGTPSKAFLNGNYSGDSSIVTSLDSNYRTRDTSSFEIRFDNVPQYLGIFLPMEIYMTHRFLIDSTDFGEITISVNEGETWHNIQGPNTASEKERYFAYHYYESTSDTSFDSLVVRGSSGGWIRSRLIVGRLQQYMDNDPNITNSAIIKFTFVSDSAFNDEGWQIDSICLKEDFITSIEETRTTQMFTVSPNPSDGRITLYQSSDKITAFRIVNQFGQEVYRDLMTQRTETRILDLIPGIYFVMVRNDNGFYSSKLVIE